MEVLVLLAIAAVVWVASLMMKLSSTDVDAGENIPQGSFGEAFPEVEILSPVQEPVKRQATDVKKNQKVKKPETHRTIAQPVAEPIVEHKKEKSIYAVKDKSDAKKAVIYAEIFGKKYF